MDNTFKPDKNVVLEGRSETLESGDYKLEVPLRDQISSKLLTKLKDKNAGEWLANLWTKGNNDRQEWLNRQKQLLDEFDEFLSDIYAKPQDWQSSIHLPIAFTAAKTMHARFYAALVDIDPPFTVTARQASNVDRARLAQELMRYTLKSWTNEHMGVDDVLDRWLWDWVTTGCGILKARWLCKYSKFVDVVEKKVPQITSRVNPETGEIEFVQGVKIEESEEEIVKKVFNGPMLERVAIEDLVIIGGEGDPQKADAVFQQQMMTASELWTLVDEGIFKKEAVENVIKGGSQKEGHDGTSNIKYERAIKAGMSNPDENYVNERYRILECYCKLDVYNSGINSDLIVWINPETREILHANYLYRYMPSGLVPFFKIDFYKRNGQTYGIGLIELLYSLSKELDAMHNIRVDVGVMTSMPFGFYRPTSSVAEEKLFTEPGGMIPLDNPSTDVFFPNFGNRTGFGMQEEQNLVQWIERMTSISDMSLGVLGAQGVARTATGARALVGEANANLNIFVRRMNLGWKRALTYLWNLLQKRIDPGFQFRILGDDGQAYWAQIESREELQGMFDFELEPNSANSNKAIQVENAQQLYQMTANPIDLQLGLISPLERFEAIKNLMQQMGIKDWSKYVRKPSGVGRAFTPEELANRVLANVPVQLDPSQDLQGFISYVEYIFQHDEILGQFGEEQAIALEQKRREAAALLQALQQQEAQAANIMQQRINQQSPGQSAVPSNSQREAQPAPQSSTSEEG